MCRGFLEIACNEEMENLIHSLSFRCLRNIRTTEISMGDVEYWRKSQANGQLWMQIELNYA